jgi:hypothetical protein
MSLKEASDKKKCFRLVERPSALFYFEHHLERRLKTEDLDVHGTMTS